MRITTHETKSESANDGMKKMPFSITAKTYIREKDVRTLFMLNRGKIPDKVLCLCG